MRVRERKRESFQEACRGKRNVFKEREKERERESDPNGRKPEGRWRKSAFRHGSGSPRKVHGLREVINDGAGGVGGRSSYAIKKKKKLDGANAPTPNGCIWWFPLAICTIRAQLRTAWPCARNGWGQAPDQNHRGATTRATATTHRPQHSRFALVFNVCLFRFVS